MQSGFPLHYDGLGRTVSCSEEKHIRDLIEQVLFTSPWERVNRPTFGSGILKLLFSPNSDTLAAATNLTVQGALQQWLGDLISVESVEIRGEDAVLKVAVQYTIRRSQQRQVVLFSRGGQ